MGSGMFDGLQYVIIAGLIAIVAWMVYGGVQLVRWVFL